MPALVAVYFKERGVSFENSRALLEMYKPTSRKAMTSGALKTVPDKSVFITYLIKNLINNDQPLLSAEELFRTVTMKRSKPVSPSPLRVDYGEKTLIYIYFSRNFELANKGI